MEKKRNYQKELDSLLAGLDGERPKLLLHACCGPCSSYVIEFLAEFFEITILYYNQNIYPNEEYKDEQGITDCKEALQHIPELLAKGESLFPIKDER